MVYKTNILCFQVRKKIYEIKTKFPRTALTLRPWPWPPSIAPDPQGWPNIAPKGVAYNLYVAVLLPEAAKRIDSYHQNNAVV